MDWEDYQHLLALARTRTLSEAGVRLGVARTTVARRVAALEQRLGVRLFHREPDGFVLTAAGEELARVAARLEEEVLAGEAQVLGRDMELRGALRVSTLEFLYNRFAGVFHAFIQQYPHVQLTVSATPERASLRRREADVVLRLSDTPSPELVGRRLRRVAFRPYASRALVQRIGEGAPPSAFPWLADDDHDTRPWVDAWLAQHVPGAQIVMRYDGYPALRASVRAGIGAHPLAELEAEQDPDLVAIAPLIPVITRDLWALTLPELKTSRRVRALMEHLYATIGADGG